MTLRRYWKLFTDDPLLNRREQRQQMSGPKKPCDLGLSVLLALVVVGQSRYFSGSGQDCFGNKFFHII